VVPRRSKQRLEVVVGARQIRDLGAVEEPGPIASRHLVDVVDRRRERSGFGRGAGPGADQAIEATAHDRRPGPVRIAKKARGGMDPATGPEDVGPERRRAREPARHRLREAPEPRRERAAPFCASCVRLRSSFSSRPLSFSPEAASGARPSSVIAERTAAAWPRTSSASRPSSPSTAWSIARMPRRCFFSSFLACRSASNTGWAASRRTCNWQGGSRHPRQGRGNGPADRVLPIADHALDRHPQAGHLSEQGHEILGGGGQQAARQEHRARQAVAQDPQHLVADIGLKAIQPQEDAALGRKPPAQPLAVGPGGGDELVVAVQKVGHLRQADGQAAGTELGMDLGHRAVVAMTKKAHQRDHVETELVVGQRQRAFGLRPEDMRAVGAARHLAARGP
jgi:hypothetical protein